MKIIQDGVCENFTAAMLTTYLDGQVEPGKRADLVVLDRNLFTQPATEIALAEVDLTLVDGSVVYARPGT